MVVPLRSQVRLRLSRLSVQHGRSTSFASSLAVLPASLGSSTAIAATGCAVSFALIGLTSRCFAHRARASCAPRHCHPHSQFPLKSYGFPGAETAGKRFLLWKMGFSAAAYCEPLHPSIQHGRPTPSHRPALTLARCSAPADFASLRVLGAPAASRPPTLASSLVALPASLGLLRAVSLSNAILLASCVPLFSCAASVTGFFAKKPR